MTLDPLDIVNEEHHTKHGKHTPGPWWRTAGLINSKHGVIATYTGPADTLAKYAGKNRADVQDANANLIAAAPGLLEACKGRLEADETYEQGTEEWADAVKKADEQMRDAIKKAEGK